MSIVSLTVVRTRVVVEALTPSCSTMVYRTARMYRVLPYPVSTTHGPRSEVECVLLHRHLQGVEEVQRFLHPCDWRLRDPV